MSPQSCTHSHALLSPRLRFTCHIHARRPRQRRQSIHDDGEANRPEKCDHVHVKKLQLWRDEIEIHVLRNRPHFPIQDLRHGIYVRKWSMCVHGCMHVKTHACVCICMHVRMHIHTCTQVHACVPVPHIQACTNMRANVRRQQTHDNTRATRHAQQYMHAYTYAARPDTYYSASVCEQIKVSISHHPRHSRFRPDRTHHAQRHITKGVPTTHRHILQCLA